MKRVLGLVFALALLAASATAQTPTSAYPTDDGRASGPSGSRPQLGPQEIPVGPATPQAQPPSPLENLPMGPEAKPSQLGNTTGNTTRGGNTTAAPNVLAPPPPKPLGPPDPKDPRSWLWEYRVQDFSDQQYQAAVDGLFADYERRLGRKIAPGPKRSVGLKVMTDRVGLSTPPGLVRAVINALVARGYKPEELFIIDQNESRLRAAGFLPPLGSDAPETFAGVPVLVLNRGKYYSSVWRYDSPLPASDSLAQRRVRANYEWKVQTNDRWSLLPVPLLLSVDFWINLPVGEDFPDLGVGGSLINASLLAGSNTQRFFDNPQTGAVAVAEIAAIPELVRGWIFTILSLQQYQFIGGPLYNSLYTGSEPTVLLSANPVILDYLLFDRMNTARAGQNFPLLDRPAFLDYATQMDLGDYQKNRIFLVRLPK
jgi:hypothetical protein